MFFVWSLTHATWKEKFEYSQQELILWPSFRLLIHMLIQETHES